MKRARMLSAKRKAEKKAKAQATKSIWGEAVLIVWLSKLALPYTNLSTNVLREISSFFPGLVLLPGAYGDLLRIFNLNEEKRTSVHIEEILGMPQFVMLDRITALALGEKVLSINLLNCETTAWPKMLIVRWQAGFAKVDSKVFVFGGITTEHLRSCEVLDTVARTWSALPDMKYQRYNFMPCVFRSEVYLQRLVRNQMFLLPGTAREDYTELEVFSPATLTFRCLPVAQDELGGFSISFACGDEIYVLTDQMRLGRWRPAQEAFTVTSVQAQKQYCVQSNCPAVLLGTNVFWVCRDHHKLMKLALDTLQITGG